LGALLTHHLIDFRAAVGAVPADVGEEARGCFEEIANGLTGIPEDHAFWGSVRDTRLCLLVRGWSFFYSLDGETLRITEVRREVR
jgi:hypothetical protein